MYMYIGVSSVISESVSAGCKVFLRISGNYSTSTLMRAGYDVGMRGFRRAVREAVKVQLSLSLSLPTHTKLSGFL